MCLALTSSPDYGILARNQIKASLGHTLWMVAVFLLIVGILPIIGGIILWGGVQIVRESADILLEAVPRHLQVDKVIETIKKVSGVDAVHDIHIWTITSNIHALSAHLVIEDQTVSRSAEIVQTVNHDLAKYFNIIHTTLQLECENCPTGLICDISRPDYQ